MAFTDEQEKAILDFVTKASQTPAAAVTPPVAAPVANVNPSETPAAKTIAEEAKAQMEAEKANSTNLTQIQSSIKFNMGVAKFVEDNKNLLPEEASKILSTAAVKTFKDDNEKANVVRKNLLDSFLSQQENIDSLTVSLATRATEFKALAESDKEKRSSEFWDLAEIGIALKAGIRKAEALNKINGGNVGDSGSVLESKFLAAAKKKFNNEK